MAQRLVLSPQLMIPELLARFPQTRAVLDRYGLRGCGGPDGPRETLQFFSRTHGVDEATLLDELRHAIARSREHYGATAPAEERAAPGIADAIYRPYFLAGMAMVLSLGAVWGAYLLWKIGIVGDFHGVTIYEVNAHGHAQIFGWVGLFIMGFALQALPRMWHVELPAPRLAIIAWLAMVGGILVRSIAMAMHTRPHAGEIALAAGAVELFAIAAVTAVLIVAFRRKRVRMEACMAFVMASLGWFVLQTAYGMWHIWAVMTAASRDQMLWQLATYQAPLRDMQIHGMALFMILGVSIRMLPAMFGLPPISEKRAWWAFGLLMLAVVGESTLFVVYRWTENHALAGALMIFWLMLAAGVLIVALPWRFWRPMPTRDRSAKFVRAAYGWLALSLLMLLLLPVYQVISGIPFSHAYYGAIRHAVTVGFISLMIMGIAAKVAPTLTGRDPRTLPALTGAFVLVNLGCALRVSTQTLTDWHDGFFALIGISGTLEVTGLALWAAHLAAMMLRRPEAADHTPTAPPPDRIEGDHIVADVLGWWPQTLAVFERFGFTMLRNAAVRRTMARRVTVQQAAAMRSVDAAELLEALNATASPVAHAHPPQAAAVRLTISTPRASAQGVGA